MPGFVQISVLPASAVCEPKARPATVLWLQGITLVWMTLEFGVAAYAAITAHSPALLAFGSDSLVELFSAGVVLLQWIPGLSIPSRTATRLTAWLLFVLAFVVAATAIASLASRQQPEVTRAGIGVTLAALLAMPALAWLKRREAGRIGNAALAADAVQSATCAYLAGITLVGLTANAFFHIVWFDSLAALIALPILIKEGRSAWQGQSCGCC